MKTGIKKRLQEQEIFSSKEMVCVIGVMLCLIIVILCYYEETVEQQNYQYQCALKNGHSSIVLKRSNDGLHLSMPEVLKFNEAKELIEFFENFRVVIKWAPIKPESLAQTSEFINYMIDHGYSFYLLEKNGILGPEFNKDHLLNVKSDIELVLIRKNKYTEAEIGYQSLLK